jgi:hypothetical protein
MILKILQVVLLASVKYFLTIPYALLIGLQYEYAVASIILGGIGGFLAFYYLLKPVSHYIRSIKPWICRIVPAPIQARYSKLCTRYLWPGQRLLFTRRNRRIVKIKRSFGLWGIVITTPVLLSIPVGAFLARHYYAHNRRIVAYMLCSIVGWGVVFSAILSLFPGIFQ